MSPHTYPASCVASDLLRAGTGLVICGAPLVIAADPLPALQVILAVLLAFFALAAGRAILLARTRVAWDDRAVHTLGWRRRRLDWRDLRRLKLAYYSTRRDRSNGWLQLSLADASGRLTFDSRLDDFPGLVRQAARSALANGVPLDPATRYNLQMLGIAAEALDMATSGR